MDDLYIISDGGYCAMKEIKKGTLKMEKNQHMVIQSMENKDCALKIS